MFVVGPAITNFYHPNGYILSRRILSRSCIISRTPSLLSPASALFESIFIWPTSGRGRREKCFRGFSFFSPLLCNCFSRRSYRAPSNRQKSIKKKPCQMGRAPLLIISWKSENAGLPGKVNLGSAPRLANLVGSIQLKIFAEVELNWIYFSKLCPDSWLG